MGEACRGEGLDACEGQADRGVVPENVESGVARDLVAARPAEARALEEIMEWHEASRKSGWVLGQPLVR